MCMPTSSTLQSIGRRLCSRSHSLPLHQRPSIARCAGGSAPGRKHQRPRLRLEEKEACLKYVDILKVNEHEMHVLTGETEVLAAARRLEGWGVREVVITEGSLGSFIYAEGKLVEIRAIRRVNSPMPPVAETPI